MARQVAAARAAREAKEAEVAAVNDGLGELPMVLGRSLDKTIAGARPTESYDLIRHELIYREIEDQVRKAQKVHRGSLEASTGQWIAEQVKINEEMHFQTTLNKLAAIGDKVKESFFQVSILC